MLLAVIGVVVLFQNSSGLAAAYGIAVTGAMMVTTIAISIVMIKKWRWPWPVVLAVLGFFLTIEGFLLAANITKIASGGWLPLVTALLLFTLFTTWFRGQRILNRTLDLGSIPVRDFIDDMVKQSYRRVPGTAVYMTARKHIVPQALLMNLRMNKILHENIVLLTVQTTNEPYADPGDRFHVYELAQDFYRVTLYYGFLEEPNIDRDLQLCRFERAPILEQDVTFFVGHESILPTRGTGMAIWREHIYAWMKRNAGSAIDFYRVPSGKVMEIGGHYEI
jgi:KUP system potassium uptake protein